MEAWKKFLEQTKVIDLLEPNFKMIWAKNTDSVLDVIKLLRETQIISVPIFNDETKEWMGLVDIFDILTVMIFMTDVKILVDTVNRKEVDWHQYIQQELKILQEEKIEMVINASERNPWCPVSHCKPLHSLMDMLADANLHRVPIVNDDGEVIGIITQSAVINFLYKHVDQFPDNAAIKVKSCFQPSKVISIEVNKTALEAFKLMITEKVSGVAVVDEQGKLVASLSSSDLKGSMDCNLFHDLYLPISLYSEKTLPDLFDKKNCTSPISCTLDTSIYELLHKLASNRIHRLFVVDSENKPIGVLSLCNIIAMMDHVDLEVGKQKGFQQMNPEQNIC